MKKKQVKKQGKKAFTLVELLAVIVILAVILVIVAPMIGDTLTSSEEKVFKLNAEQAVKMAKMHYQQNFSGKLNSTPVTYVVENNKMTQNDVDVDLSTSMGDMTGEIIINSDGNAKVKLYNDEYCVTKSFNGSLLISELENGECNLLEDIFLAKIGTGGLIKDDHNELRYQGENPDNYVTFNDEEAGWRIVGLFNVDGEQRVKLVRKDSIGSFSWDSSKSSINSGYGINQWGPSGTYEGADLMRELNTDYLNSSLSENVTWYGAPGIVNEFNKDYVLIQEAQDLIGNATWYTSGVQNSNSVTLADAYASERGTQGKRCSSGNDCNDDVERTYTWMGKVGLIYLSDYGYASSNADCATNMKATNNCRNNWMLYYGWTITPKPETSNAFSVWQFSTAVVYNSSYARTANPVRPSVYLIPGVQMKGSGTTADPYVFTK